jgi:DNA mismatch repair protein MutS
VQNFHFAVKETKNDVIFLRRLIPGATDKSYGIHVARLAGIPGKVTERADVILSRAAGVSADPGRKAQRYTQLLLVDGSEPGAAPAPHPVLDEIQNLDPDNMTPLQALEKLHELRLRLSAYGGEGHGER